ncbi:MAG TPA: Do family serine endopeptidase [Candidatus Aminicenantes bacterium]|nr:Do family serine endopeptidase [Candidatus Aminicenantes bacterium]HRY65923.1 Do family serine endopeptidase [Candidatus Aminicenantes bacterium]HRZ72751.1 Do family serine endopeptidase [Candidatus Aminicenantes bacterium]
MKKYAWIAVSSFTLGLLLAGYVFLYLPEKPAAPRDVFAQAAPAPAPSANLFAESVPQDKPALDFVSIAEKVGPAVVRIEADRRESAGAQGFGGEWPFGDDFFDRIFPQPRQRQPESNTVQVGGTGFFISADGYILTNNHMVEKDKTTRVAVTTLAGDEYEAKIIGTDPGTDLALIKIEAKGLPFAELGDSSRVKVGEWVLAIGNPMGLDNTVTAGIVSYKGRSIDTQSYQDFIQTDAAINRGNSGGPLINMRGEVIGINSSIVTSGFGGGGNIGIGFAIPSDIARKVVVQLKEKGRVVRGRIGVQIRDLTEGMVKQFNLKSKDGAMVNSVEPDSPAEKAKLQRYDVIVQVNGQPVKNGEELRFRIADIQPGGKVELTIIRDGQQIKVTAIADELEPEKEKGQIASADKDIGVSVVALTPGSARRYGLRTTEGLLITEVRQGSEADRANLAAGMIIIEANRRKMTTVRDFEDILKKTAKGDEIILLVRQETEQKSQDFIVTVKVR